MLILLTICQGRRRALQLDDLQEWRLIKGSFLSSPLSIAKPSSISPSGQLT